MEKYMQEYMDKLVTAEQMIYDRFRDRELLNGQWHYAVDQYDSCIRQKWFHENYFLMTMEIPCRLIFHLMNGRSCSTERKRKSVFENWCSQLYVQGFSE